MAECTNALTRQSIHYGKICNWQSRKEKCGLGLQRQRRKVYIVSCIS